MRLGFAVLLVAVVLMAAPASAQPAAPLPSPDFLFGQPRASASVRGGWEFMRARSDWYDFVTDTLTIERRDFNRPAVGADLGVALSGRVELVASLDFSKSTTLSQYRDFVDNRRLPIEQTTDLRQTNLSGGVKLYPLDRGREISRLAWVPRAVVPYVGAGAGVLWYEMRQYGDFVDFADDSVFGDAFVSTGAAPSAHVFGGVELKVWKRLYLTMDARYLWAAGDLGQDWIDFEPIDLTGARVAAGVNILF